MANGYETCPERGERCERCFRLRLEETVKMAAAGDYDYFCTTLSISPHKNADLLMQIGEELAQVYGVSYLPSDFKKKNGYKRSIELSAEYNLYRQDYCGCVFSKAARRQKGEKGEEH
jgi:predicted adenine nucleotide alpha hydrolase (AANH) superfamily ATPase